MIAGIRGKLESRRADGVVVRVDGVSLLVQTPSSTLDNLGRPGAEVELHTHLHLRQDNITLYGFSTVEELGLFQEIIGVSGLGPKTALALLSTYPPEQLAPAIINGNIDLLSRVPGVGKKTASRLVLELKGKLEKGWDGVAPALVAESNADVVAALTALGYTASEAAKAVSAQPQGNDLSLEEKVRVALQRLGERG
jgi:Holliday junction DNA helicase RuvA